MPSHKHFRQRDLDESQTTCHPPRNKRKRKRVLPQERKRRATKYRNSLKKQQYRSSKKYTRLYLSIINHEYLRDAISASEDLLQSLVDANATSKSLLDDISCDIRLMRSRASRFYSQYEGAKATLTSNRCKRKRKKKESLNNKYVQTIIRRRRQNRNLNKPSVKDSYCDLSKKIELTNKEQSLFDSDEALSEEDSISSHISIDSELEDETYVPEVLCRKKRKKRQKAWGKRGNNQSALVDKDDIFAEEYESLNDRYQFAIDLKKKDHQPGKNDSNISDFLITVVAKTLYPNVFQLSKTNG